MSDPRPGVTPRPTRDFPTCDVLSTITGRLVSSDGIGGVYAVLNWMTGESVYTHQIPRISREARTYLVKMRPELQQAVGEARRVNPKNWQKWAAIWVNRYGQTIAIPKFTADDHESIDPISELAEIMPPDRIIVVKT